MIYVEDGEEIFVTETVYNKETGLPTRQHTTLNKLKHAPPDGNPSLIAFDDDGNPSLMCWHEADVEHRLEGPSTIALYPSGVHQAEMYKIHGKPRPKSEGPFRIRRSEDGSIYSEEFADEFQYLSKKPPQP